MTIVYEEMIGTLADYLHIPLFIIMQSAERNSHNTSLILVFDRTVYFLIRERKRRSILRAFSERNSPLQNPVYDFTLKYLRKDHKSSAKF